MPRPRSPLKSLANTLDHSDALVALFDEQRQLVYASDACARWLGVNADDLTGRTAIFSSEPQSDPLDAAVAKISPPADAFQGIASQTQLVGNSDRRLARFVPLPIEGNRSAVLLVAHSSPAETSAEVRSASSDWHVALAQVRAQLPGSLQSEYLAGEHPLMRRLREQVQVAAKTKTRTVVIGPRGSGTAEIAAVIHVLGGGRNEGLIPLHCPLQDAETLQAAIRTVSRKTSRGDRPPAILLRDMHLLPDAAQQELLGFLQLPGFDVRIVCTSRISLASLAKKGKLVPELAALLGTLELRVPPLVTRPEDIPLLAQLFLERFNLQNGSPFRGFVPEAIEQLVSYGWPENVQELERTIAQTCQRSAGPWIVASDLNERLRGNWQNVAHPPRVIEPIQLDAALAEAEKTLLSQALAQAKGNKSEAARLLSISRPRLLRRLVQLGLAAAPDVIEFEPLDDEPSQEAS
jgi:DNA-binding NtrC family response regulator